MYEEQPNQMLLKLQTKKKKKKKGTILRRERKENEIARPAQGGALLEK